jgi:hypothetical protein
MYNVLEKTLYSWRARTLSQRNIHPNSAKLQRLEEEVIIKRIRKLNAQGFTPTLSYIHEIANQLLAARGGREVGEK